MLTLNAVAQTSASPDQVIAAARDFSERRADIWPNVKAGHFEVHATGDTFTEATEYLWPLGFYERCRYEWPRPDQVRATVLESNVLTCGSTWELTTIPTDDGARVETVFRRDFRRTARGRIAKLLNRTVARRALAADLRHAMANVERHAPAARSTVSA
jgi:hypothetical protein